MKNKWIIFTVAVAFLAINLLNTDFSTYQQLRPADSVPVVAIALVIFLFKIGGLSALLIGIKKLLEWLARK